VAVRDAPQSPTGPLRIGQANASRRGRRLRPDGGRSRREAGLYLSISSGFRSDAEQAVLWNANPNPKWETPPGISLHRYATELDLGPPAAYDWLWQTTAASASSAATPGSPGTRSCQ
jgi:hypothetical protein